MSEQTLHLVDRLRQRLRRTIRRITLADLAFGAVLTLGALAGGWLLSVAVEAGLWLDTTPRTVLFWAFALVALGLAGYFLVAPLLRLAGLLPTLSEEAVARRIGAHYPAVSDRLVNLLQLAGGRRTASSDQMVDRAVARLGEEVQPVPFEEVEDFGRARRASRWAALPVLGLLVFLVAAPGTFLGASARLLAPSVHFQRPAPFQLALEPASAELVRGDSLEITVRAAGEALPATVTLALNTLGEEHVEEIELTPEARGVFHHTLRGVRSSLRYRARAHPVETAWHEATVVERPLVRTLQVSLDPPSYTGLPAQRLDANVGDVTALPGTRVALDVQLGGPAVEEAFIAFDDGTREPLALDGGTARGTFTLQRAGSYRVILQSAQGVENQDPITYQMELRTDAAPTVTLLAPEPAATLDDDLRAQLRFRMSDDFGFARLRLYYRMAERRYGDAMADFAAIDLPLDEPSMLDQEVVHDWLLTRSTDLDPLPGDVIEYYVQVWDNNRIAGYQSARTATQTLRVPSLAEKYEALDERQDEAEEQLESLVRDQETVEEQFEALRDELRRAREAGWEDQRQLEQIKEQQEQLQEGVEQFTRELEDVTRQMQEQDLISPETARLFQELQEVAREVNSPELMETLEKLQASVQNMDLEQMQQALENFEFSEAQYRERLERTLDLFKKLRLQQQMEEVTRRTGALSRQQERLAEATQALREEDAEAASGEHTQEEAAEEAERVEPQQQDDDEVATEADSSIQQQQQGEQVQGEAPQPQQQEARDAGEQQERGAQEEASQSPESSSSPEAPQREALAREQERAREAMEALEERLREIREEMSTMQGVPKEAMQQLSEQLREQELPQQMQENSEQLRQGRLQEAQEGQQQMQQQLQQAQQQMQQMQQGMQGRQQQINMAGLRRALENTLTLSDQQERLRRRVQDLPSQSPALREAAQRQAELAEGLRTVSDSLQQLARNVPQMTRAVQQETGNALREMQAALQAMNESTSQEAAARQQGSMMHLNELALRLSDLLDQMMNSQGQGGGGMSAQQLAQQLQQMAGQQEQLNQQIQQFLNDAQGNRLSVDQQERLQQMAGQQEALRRQLDALGREPGVDRQVLGSLDRIAEQMEETVRELQQNQADRRTTERQQQILTRLLDAQRSLRQRGEDERREAQTPEGDYTRESPAELSPREQADRLRRDLLRALESGYAPDYEELIKRYFELLQEIEQENSGR